MSHVDEITRLQTEGQSIAGDLYTEWLHLHISLATNVREYLRCPCKSHWTSMGETYALIERNKRDTTWPENREFA